MGIILFQVPGAFGTPSISPFCTKLQAWLRMAAIPYEVGAVDMMRAPRGKVPFARIDGELMTDSQLIIEHLAGQRGDPLDAWLTADQRTIAHLLRRALEEGTYWHIASARWRDEEGWAAYRPVFESFFPPVIRLVLPAYLRRGALTKLKGQGTGLRTLEETHRMGVADLAALAHLLGDKPFIFGDRPANVDATAFAFVDGCLAFPVRSAIHQFVWDQPNLVAYANRVRAQYFTELAPWAQTSS